MRSENEMKYEDAINLAAFLECCLTWGSCVEDEEFYFPESAVLGMRLVVEQIKKLVTELKDSAME